MDRRDFLRMAATSSVAAGIQPGARAKPNEGLPTYRTVTAHKPEGIPFPGRYPGKVIAVHAEKSIDETTAKADPAVVSAMVKQGMTALTGHSDSRDAWAQFITPADVVGIKVNASGAPHIMSNPVVVAEVVKNLMAVGVAPERIYVYERFPDQMDSIRYDQFVAKGVNIYSVEKTRSSILNYDPHTYVEVDFFGEEDTRSNLIRMVTEKFTKIVNIPNMKDHQAAGVTGCLKNIAYGNFSNVARSHQYEKTNTYSFIGTLAAVEPVRSKTVLNVMEGLRGVWHGGPFSTNPKWRFFPKQMMFGTDPVAMDRMLADVIDAKRKAEGAVSVWNRSMEHVSAKPGDDPNLCHFVRETGHIDFAGQLGLGVADPAKIQKQTFQNLMLLAAAIILPQLVSAPPADAVKLPKPGVQYKTNVASASSRPWVNANGWRLERGGPHPFYYDAPEESAALAAAEAFAYQREALIHTDAPGAALFEKMMAFLRGLGEGPKAAVANVGVIDDGSAESGEVMNLLARHNLLFRVAARPDASLPVNIQLGTAEYPKASAANPEAFAQKIRARVTDEKRILRIYGSDVVLGKVDGEAGRLRVHLINYSDRPVYGIRVRLLSEYPKTKVSSFDGAGTLRISIAKTGRRSLLCRF